MKNSFKILTLLVLGAGFSTLQSCSDETDTTDPTPSTPVCYITQEVYSDIDGSSTKNFTYDSDNNLVLAVEGKDSTIFEYSGGRLSRAFDGYTEATVIYNSGNVPERINLKEDGVDVEYLFLTKDANNNITKVEFHTLRNGGDTIEAVNHMTYDATGNLATILVEDYDYENDEFVTFLSADEFVNDGKKNPYGESLAFFYLNTDNPLVLGKSNITSATVNVAGNDFPYSSTFTYNSNNYPLTTATTFFLGNNNISFTYNCK